MLQKNSISSMRWGLPESTGHYVDLVSAVAGLILLPAGYLWRKRTGLRAGEPSKVTHISTQGRGVDDAAPRAEQRRAPAKRYEEASGVEMMGRSARRSDGGAAAKTSSQSESTPRAGTTRE